MNDKTLKIEVSVYMHPTPTRSTFIYIDSIIFIKTATSFDKLNVFTTTLHYDNEKLQDVRILSSYHGDWRYFKNDQYTKHITDNI